LIKSLDKGHELRAVAPQDVEAAIDDNTAVLLLTEVDYRTGRKHDMTRLTETAQAAGALTIWDLAHSAGALPIDLTAAKADFAVGCTYKYLNGGPGAPAFIYLRPDHAGHLRPALSGWLGHAAPFAFDRDYRAGTGIERMRVGTPPVIALAALETALDVFESVDLHDIRSKSIELSDLFIAEVERRCPDLALVSPNDSALRGSHVSFAYAEGYAVMQALIDRGVIGDFRAPDILRFGIAPLYLDADDVIRAASVLEDIVVQRAWDRPRYRQRQTVT